MPEKDGIREELVPFTQGAAFQRDNSPPNHRGRGAGSAMLGRVIEEAVGLGLRVVALDVGARNSGAIRLYSRLGFEVASKRRIGPLRGWAELESLRMELPLAGRE